MSDCRGSRRRGIAIIWVAITLFCMILLCGLAMDMSIAVYSKQQLQNAADASALAGAALVRSDPVAAQLQAQKVSLANSVQGKAVELDLNNENTVGGEIVIGRYNRKTKSFAADLSAPNAMKVSARRTAASHGPIPLAFGPIARVNKSSPGVDSVDLRADAIAMIGGGTGGGMIVLDPNQECAADFGGSVTINVTDISVNPPQPGTIKVNSDNAAAMCANGSAVTIEAGLIQVGGDSDLGNAYYDGEIETDSPPVKDPLADLPAISTAGMNVVPIPAKGNVTVPPGYHGACSRNGGIITLESGVHVFSSEGFATGTSTAAPGSVAFSISGNAGVQCVPNGGVLLYILQGALELNGSGGARLDPLNAPVGSPDAQYNGITIFQARDNFSVSKLGGGSGLDLTGTLYFPNNKLDIHGGGSGYGNQLIANTIETFGSGEIKIMYDGRFPALGDQVFLVQ